MRFFPLSSKNTNKCRPLSNVWQRTFHTCLICPSLAIHAEFELNVKWDLVAGYSFIITIQCKTAKNVLPHFGSIRIRNCVLETFLKSANRTHNRWSPLWFVVFVCLWTLNTQSQREIKRMRAREKGRAAKCDSVQIATE